MLTRTHVASKLSSSRLAAGRPMSTSHIRRAVVNPAAYVPITGHHNVKDALRDEALELFFEKEELKCTPTSGGVNNVVQYVETSTGQRFVLRIYNNGNKSDKVQFEHEVLRQLHELERTSGNKMSFDLPRALPSKAGRPHELLSSGAEACVFHIIEGTLAKTTSPEEVGRATGELCTVMAGVRYDVMPAPFNVEGNTPIAPYWQLFKAHHAVGTREKFYNEIDTNAGFEVCREAITYLVEQIREIEVRMESFKKMGMPVQYIHADLHYDNVMVVGDKVSGLLDFEFCTYDWRAMELAVALSKYVGEAEPLPLCERFVKGYVQNGDLTSAEIDCIPDMINLRIFSNVVYFTGRAISGEDSLDSLTSRAGVYAKRVRWVNANREAIKDTIKNAIKTAPLPPLLSPEPLEDYLASR